MGSSSPVVDDETIIGGNFLGDFMVTQNGVTEKLDVSQIIGKNVPIPKDANEALDENNPYSLYWRVRGGVSQILGGFLSIQYPDVSCCILMYPAKILYPDVF